MGSACEPRVCGTSGGQFLIAVASVVIVDRCSFGWD
jgi:hypothetical protein